MRLLAVYLTLLVLLLVSVGAGFIASDWPRWCSRAHWCSGPWPRHAAGAGTGAGPDPGQIPAPGQFRARLPQGR